MTSGAIRSARRNSEHAEIRKLADTDLLSMIVPRSSASTLLNTACGLRRALEQSSDELARVAGIGAYRARVLVAARELGRRYAETPITAGEEMTSANRLRTALLAHMRDLTEEHFVVIFCDNRYRIIECETMFTGTINVTHVYPRVIVRRALELNAAAVAVCHNHISGFAMPSDSDRAITNKINEALALIDVTLLDHFIVGNGEVLSFAEHGWM